MNNLKTLSIFHFIMSGFTAFVSSFPLIHVTIGILLLVFSANGFFENQDEAPPAAVGILFIIIGGFVVILGWTLAFLIFLSGRYLRNAKKYGYCLVIAGILCLMMPYGTVLGVFTIILLTREPVKKLFSENK